MVVAFIPVRGGSKSIPLKNIRMLNGKPLVYWAVKAACEAHQVDKVFVSTDCSVIRDVVEGFRLTKVCVIDRSFETATDTASTESAMLEFALKYDFSTIVLIQATSPLVTGNNIDEGLSLLLSENTDSVLSVVKQKRFIWEFKSNGFVESQNYKVFQRPRRQDFNGYLVENGAFYITTKRQLLESKCRISGNIKSIEMEASSFFEIDEPDDWDYIEHLMSLKSCLNSENTKIRMVLTDCDGVLTDGGMYYTENGDELKKFNTRDGMGFELLRNHGVLTGIITGESSGLVKKRAAKLRVDEVHLGVKNKYEIIKSIANKYGLKLEEIAFIGDDINDIEAVKAVGYGCCVFDSIPDLQRVAKYKTKLKGGEGAFREVVDFFIERSCI